MNSRKVALPALTGILLSVPALAQKLPNVVVLATGGTIAGAAGSDVQAGVHFRSGRASSSCSPPCRRRRSSRPCRGEQISNIGSQDMNDEVWLKLARRVNELVAMPDVDGVVITHGTDTIEETAYFLNLVVKSRKPVVLTAAMRPSTALSADGPLNFYNAVAVAANKDAAGRGVLVVVNDWIHGASSLTKTSTTAVQTFLSPLRGWSAPSPTGGRVLSRPGREEHRGLGVLARRRHGAAPGRHHDGPREHGRRAHRRRGRGRGEGNRDRRRRQRQHDRVRPRSARRAGEEGHRLRARLARRHRPGGPQRGGG